MGSGIAKCNKILHILGASKFCFSHFVILAQLSSIFYDASRCMQLHSKHTGHFLTVGTNYATSTKQSVTSCRL